MALREFIKEQIKLAQEAYYNGTPLISDEEYDVLVGRFPDLETEIGPAGDVPHLYRMYSLQKVYLDRGDERPFTGETYETIKLDGCAVDILYMGGELAQILTRGDGKKGKDVTDNVSMLNVPRKIKQLLPTQITGEVIPLGDVENKRNYASGKVNLKDQDDFMDAIGEGQLIFVAYGVQSDKDQVGLNGTYAEDMKWLEAQGFMTVGDTSGVLNNAPTDGRVVRINSNNEFNRMGFTNKFPRGAYALKEDDDGVETTLLNVTWQVGASGKVTPVGHFESIVIDDAVITKATLNNVDYIEALDLEIGCRIRVIRAGGIIPKIVERIYE
ncbi:DNA ligase [Serratia phage vB_SmaM-Kamaji]|nr:DNA ligase [Serratia phage vB_SmaM-Kamaji]